LRWVHFHKHYSESRFLEWVTGNAAFLSTLLLRSSRGPSTASGSFSFFPLASESLTGERDSSVDCDVSLPSLAHRCFQSECGELFWINSNVEFLFASQIRVEIYG
jgi:hypothetical protein